MLHCGNLTQQFIIQQFIIDSYIKLEANRLNYYKTHQKDLRISTYQGISDYFNNSRANVSYLPGNKQILPSTFIGSPRSQNQNYQDAMAIVTKYGKPDLFLTFTCNPNWAEIVENLRYNEKPCDRPDLIVRVFKHKFDDFLKSIIHRHCLGKLILNFKL